MEAVNLLQSGQTQLLMQEESAATGALNRNSPLISAENFAGLPFPAFGQFGV